MHLICCIKKRNYICDMKEKEEYKIGKLLASIRKTMGLSQTEVAEKSHVTRQNISRIELGKYSPGADVIQRIEEALGVERIYIYNPQNEKMRVSETKGLKNPQIPKTKRLLFIQTHKRQRNPKTTRFPASCFIHSIQTEHHLYRKSN